MTVIDLNKTKRRQRPSARDLIEIDKSSSAGRFFEKMRRDIIADLGGRRQLTRIELEWIGVFCGCATQVRYLNHQVFLGETSEVDPSGYATLGSTMLRIGSKLGLKHREPKDQTFGDLLLADAKRQQIEDRERNQKQREEFEEKQRARAASATATELNNAP